MRLRKALFVPLLVAATAFAPQAYAEDDITGFTCGFAVGDDDPASEQNTTTTGEITGGPMVVLNPNTVSVTVSCWLQLNSGVYGTNIISSSTTSATTSGNVGATAGIITVDIPFNTAVYLCTQIDWVSDQGAQTFQWDDDDTSAGNQCSLAISV